MVSCIISWNGISRPTIVDSSKVKVSGLLPAMKTMYPDDDGIFAQDGASSHTSDACQDLLIKEFGKGRKISKTQWPPKSPDLNPLDYYFWNEVQGKVFEGRRKPFESLEHLKKAILQFRPRLLAVMNAKGGPIKHIFE